jgi:8-oxo-dGTP pyrophosphatase MutT (NUDIX family)
VPLPAATLMLLRDGPAGLEVLMLERHRDAFFSRALVFPGGRVDPEDADPGTLAHCRAGQGADIAFRVAAIRESYEEAGILLACETGGEGLIVSAALAALAARHGPGQPHLAALLAEGAIELATDRLVPYAHWLTPDRSPKRYDTLFFLAAAPPDQEPRPDGREAVETVWIAPQTALADADAGRRRLIFATRMNLRRLAQSPDVATALSVARKPDHLIARICPDMYDTPEGTRIRISGGLGYDACDMPTPDNRHG